MFLGPGPAPYDVLLPNMIEPKPVMRYVPDYPPVYNENSVYWNEPEGGSHCPNDEIQDLRRQIEELSHQTMHIHTDRLRHAQEVNRLRNQLKVTMEATTYLQRGFMTHEMELMRLWQTVEARKGENRPPIIEDGVIRELVNVMERLEKLVDNVVTSFKDIRTKMVDLEEKNNN